MKNHFITVALLLTISLVFAMCSHPEDAFIFENAESFHEDIASVQIFGLWGGVNTKGEFVIPFEYDESFVFIDGIARVQKDGKCGAIDKSGNVVVPFKYDSIWLFEEGLACVTKNGKFGFVNTSGKEVIPLKYDCEVSILGGYKTSYSFKNGYAPVIKKIGGYYYTALIDKNGKEVIPFKKYGLVCDYSEGLVKVMQVYVDDAGLRSMLYGFVNLHGEVVIPFIYDYVGNFSEGLCAVNLNGKSGFIDKKGDVVIPIIYEYALEFEDGVASVELNGNWNIINHDGELVLPKWYEGSYPFNNEGLMLTKVEGKWGVFDRNGAVIVPFIYDDVIYSQAGCFGAKLDGRWGVVDNKGKTILPFKYDRVGSNSFVDGYAMVEMNGYCGFLDRRGKPLKIKF